MPNPRYGSGTKKLVKTTVVSMQDETLAAVMHPAKSPFNARQIKPL